MTYIEEKSAEGCYDAPDCLAKKGAWFMQFSHRAESITPFYAMAFSEKASALEAKGHHVVKLNIGEPDFGAPPQVADAMKEAVASGNLPYTSALGLPQLREAIADFYHHQHGVKINAKRVVVTAGASAALLLVCAALINDGDQVLLADPSYPCNRQFIRSFGGVLQQVPTTASSRYQLDLENVKAHWQKNTKGIMMATPSNPTGTTIPKEELRAICDHAREHGAWRIVDEIYLNLHLTDTAPQTALALDSDAIVINSFSKYFGMTGWRLGWCVVPEVMVDVMEKLAQNLYICPSTPAQFAALACFTPASLSLCEQRRKALVNRKAYVLKALQHCQLPVEVAPEGAFYTYIDVSSTGLTAMTFCERLLENHHVALTPGTDFGETTGLTHVRLSFATAEHELEEGLKRIAKFVSTLRSKPA